MKIHVDKSGTPSALKETLDSALAGGGVRSLLVLACDGNDFTPERVDPILQDVPVPVFGGTFPIIMHGVTQMSRGTIVVAMRRTADTYVVEGLSDSGRDYEDILDAMVGDSEHHRTLMVFVDGMARRVGAFIDALYAIFGLEVNYIGGGAGAMTFAPKHCLITNAGLLRDAAVVAAFSMESGIGMGHGWSTVGGPYKVTESESNVVKSLDWRPAFDVYKSVVEAHCGVPFISRSYFDMAKAYPFGIAKMGSERVVRDPLTIDGDQNLICVGEVPVGEYVDILHGEPDDLLEAARKTLQLARDDFPEGAVPGFGLVMDCVSRALFLGDRFSEELKALVAEDIPTVGACSIGEIANSGRDYLELYNKTSVVALLEDE